MGEGVGYGAMGLGGLGARAAGGFVIVEGGTDWERKLGFQRLGRPGLFRDDLFSPINGHQQLIIAGEGHSAFVSIFHIPGARGRLTGPWNVWESW